MAKSKRKNGPEIIVNIFGSSANGRDKKCSRYLRFSPPPPTQSILHQPIPPAHDGPPIDIGGLAPDDDDPTWVTEAAVDVHDIGEPTEPQLPCSGRPKGTKKKCRVAVCDDLNFDVPR